MFAISFFLVLNQKIDFPNDRGFEYAADTARQEIIWGGTVSAFGAYGGPAGGNTSEVNSVDHV